MEKLKIAITQGNYNGTTYDILLRAAEDPAMLELCTPIVYGSAKHALAYRRALDVSTNFVSASSPEEAAADKLTILNVAEGTAEVSFGETTADSVQQERNSLQAALAACQSQSVDALVLSPATEAVPCPQDATRLILLGNCAIMPVTAEPTVDDVQHFRDILARDFDLPVPRFAIIMDSAIQDVELTGRLLESGIYAYGPFTTDQFLEGDMHLHYDAIVIMGDPDRLLGEMTAQTPVLYLAGRETVVTGAYAPPIMRLSGKGVAECSILTAPIYAAIDIVRHRAFYDEARENPLPKLYHDRREERRPSLPKDA